MIKRRYPKVARLPGESMKEYERRRWVLRRGPQRLAKRAGDRRCEFCGILLGSLYAGKKSKRYCESCRKDPETKRYMRNLYMRRYNQKKKGVTPDSLTIAEDNV